MPPEDLALGRQLVVLFVLAIPIACVAWTVTHEEVFREPREWCVRQQPVRPHAPRAEVLLPLHLRVLLQPLRDDVLPLGDPLPAASSRDGAATCSPASRLVWIANLYMSLFGRLRLDIRKERQEIDAEEKPAIVAPGATG